MDLNLTLEKWQIDFLQSDKLILALSGASNTGKSYVARLKLILHCISHANSKVFCTASTHTQTFRAIIEPMLDFLTQHKIRHIAKLHKGEGSIVFWNGSRIEIYSSEDLNLRLRSREFSIGFIEEATVIPEKQIQSIVDESIRRLRPPAPAPYHLILATNPGLKSSWLYENIYSKSSKDVFVKHLTFQEGYNRRDKDSEYKLLRASKREQDIFYWGKWGLLEGQAYNLEEGIHIQDLSLNRDPSFRYFISFDYGFSPDPMVYLLCAQSKGINYVLDEIVLRNVPLNRHAALLTRWIQAYNIVGYTGETATGSGEVRAMINENFKIPYTITTKDRTRGWEKISDLLDQKRLVINSKCSELRKSLESLIWISGTKGVDTQGDYEDPADALRYFVMATLPPTEMKVKISTIQRQTPERRYM